MCNTCGCKGAETFEARENKDGTIQSIPFKDISLNDILLVNSGDKIPTDGIIISGQGYLDESMITGESESILKSNCCLREPLYHHKINHINHLWISI